MYEKLGVLAIDKTGAENRWKSYAARLYKRSKPLNTKNAFSAAQNRSEKMAPKMANNAIANALNPSYKSSLNIAQMRKD